MCCVGDTEVAMACTDCSLFHHSSRRRTQGMTLVELVSVCALLAVIAAWAAPGFHELFLNARRTEQVNGLLRALHAARSAAILRAEPVVLCKSRDGRQCSTDASPWTLGWIVFANSDSDSPPKVDRGEEILMRQGAVPRFAVFANRNAVTYWPVALAGTTVSFVFCDERGAREARAIIVSYTGRPRISNRDASGRALVCR